MHDRSQLKNGELAELTEPTNKSTEAPTKLQVGYVLTTPGGMEVAIEEWLKTGGGVNHYIAELPEKRTALLVREAAGDLAIARLRCEAGILTDLNSAFFLNLCEGFESQQKYYAIYSKPKGTPVSELIKMSGFALDRSVSITLDVSRALLELQSLGWVLIGLRPSIIYVGDGIQLTDLSFAEPNASVPASPIHPPGFTPPELVAGRLVDGRTSVFMLGALLYYLHTGTLLSDSGTGENISSSLCTVPGLVQVLHQCLGKEETRFSGIEELNIALEEMNHSMMPGFRCTIGAATTIGLEPSRVKNEDSYGYFMLCGTSATADHACAVVCCADGMGGMDAGETASRAAVASVTGAALQFLRNSSTLNSAELGNTVKSWVDQANEHVWNRMQELNVKGGTTLTCACLVDNKLLLGHIGDSRAYLLRADELQLLSIDHSEVMALVLQGEISFDDIRTHPLRNRITRALGIDRMLAEYAVDTLMKSVHQPALELQDKDIVILCSDGLWEPVPEPEMIRLAADNLPDCQRYANALICAALSAGAPDNATVVLLRLDQVAGEGMINAEY